MVNRSFFRYFGLSLLMFGSGWAFSPVKAQCPSTIPNLSQYGAGAYSFKKINDGCLPFTISVKNNMIGVSNVRTVFDYKGGPLTPETLSKDTIHTYTKPNVYTLVQLSEVNGRELIACQRVYVYDTLQPRASLIVCGQQQAKLLFDSQQDVLYDSYWIDWGDGTIQELEEKPNTVAHTYQTPTTYPIQLWGVNKPGYCRSQVARFSFDPTLITSKPAIEELTTGPDGRGELRVSNPVKIELELLQKTETGSWQPTGQKLNGEKVALPIRSDTSSILCYKVQATDSCLIDSYASEPVCTARLTINGQENANQISWQIFPQSPDAKIIVTKDGRDWEDLTTRGEKGTLEDSDLTCNQEHCYQLIVRSARYLVTTLVPCRTTPDSFCPTSLPLFIPDAFSPNGDGINDVFTIKGEVRQGFELIVFNSWGSVIFRSQEPMLGWDGTWNNATLPAGSYAYRVKVSDPATGYVFTRAGTVLLLK